MMTHRQSRCEVAVRDSVAKCGATLIEIGTTGGNHKVALIEFGGRRRSFIFPNSASDWRSSRNVASDLSGE
jgi:hypothetical protein